MSPVFIIQTLELSRKAALPEVNNIVRSQGVLVIADDSSQGELLTPLLTPRMASDYLGFELRPSASEQNITVALHKSPNHPYNFNGNSWMPSSEPTFYTPDQIRQTLPAWAGPLQFRLKLERHSNGDSPQLQELKVGYEVPGDRLSYLIDIALPHFFSVPVQLTRWVRPSSDGLSVPLPSSFTPDRLSSVKVLSPELRPQPGTVVTTPTPRITLSTPIPQQPSRLIFQFKPRATHQPGVYQITELPCVVLRLLDGTNYRRMATEDSIRLPDGQSRLWQTTYLYDQPVEVLVIASEMEDARAIANQLMQRVSSLGHIDAPPSALEIPLHLTQGIRSGDVLEQNNLITLSFRVALLNMTEGEMTKDVPTLMEIEKDFSPKM